MCPVQIDIVVQNCSCRFYEPVVFTPNIIPVCIPEDDEDLVGRDAWVTGWGRLYEGRMDLQIIRLDKVTERVECSGVEPLFLLHLCTQLPTTIAPIHSFIVITLSSFLTQLFSDGPLPSKMQKVTLPIINNTECELMYEKAGFREHIPHIFICAGYREGGKDSCEVKMTHPDFRYTQSSTSLH